MTKKNNTYVMYGDDSGATLLTTFDNAKELERLGLIEEQKLLKIFKAETHEKAVQIYYNYNGWKYYSPKINE